MDGVFVVCAWKTVGGGCICSMDRYTFVVWSMCVCVYLCALRECTYKMSVYAHIEFLKHVLN